MNLSETIKDHFFHLNLLTLSLNIIFRRQVSTNFIISFFVFSFMRLHIIFFIIFVVDNIFNDIFLIFLFVYFYSKRIDKDLNDATLFLNSYTNFI
jgi:hypothetical protein